MENNTQYRPVSEWKFTDLDGKVEVVELERWIWTAVLDDEVEIVQFDQSGTFHRIGELDLSRVKRFSMVNTDDVRKQISIALEPYMQPFHFYRHTVLAANKPEETRLKTYVFGFKDLRSNESIYYYILPDDRLIVTADRDFNPIKTK